MLAALSRDWWVLAVRGVLAILFGISAVIWPGVAILVLAILFGAYMLLDGIFAVGMALRSRQTNNRWWVLLLEGLAGIVGGVLTFIWPNITALALVYLIAAWAFITGILEIVTAIQLRKEIDNEWLLVIDGAFSVVFGVLAALFPGGGAVAIAWMIGIYSIVFGVLFLILAFRLRGRGSTNQGASGAGA